MKFRGGNVQVYRGGVKMERVEVILFKIYDMYELILNKMIFQKFLSFILDFLSLNWYFNKRFM